MQRKVRMSLRGIMAKTKRRTAVVGSVVGWKAAHNDTTPSKRKTVR